MKQVHSPLTLGLALALAGCAHPEGAIPSLDRPKDAAQLAASSSFATMPLSPANWPQEAWWRRYGDPQLDQLLEEALVSSPGLGVSEARLRQAMALAGVARGAEGPTLTANLRDTEQRYSRVSTVPHPLAGTWSMFNETTLNLAYEVDFWGKNRNLVHAALDRVHAAQLEAQAARLMLAAGLVQAYVQLAQAHHQRDLAMAVLAQRSDTQKLVAQRVAAGIDSQVDLKQADSAIPPARQQIAAWNEAIALAQNQIAALLGQGPDAASRLARPRLALGQSFSLPSTLPAELIGRRPDIVAHRWRVEAASHDIAVAKAQFYPNVSLTAFAGFQSLGLSQFFSSGAEVAGVGPAISLPIFDSGRLRGNLGARHAEYDAAVSQYNQTLSDALRDVVDQISSIQSLQAQWRDQQEAVTTAQAADALARQRYAKGISTYLQVLATQGQLQTQQKAMLALQARALQLDASLARALGGGVLSKPSFTGSHP
jgi:NodT family efflux transporter outer membrane factor (OMF) lipoprotein